MIRSLPLALAALTLLAASAARAEDAKVTYKPAALATVEGRSALKHDIANSAEAYCRANQLPGTLAACQRAVAIEMNRQVKEHAVETAKAGEKRQLTQR